MPLRGLSGRKHGAGGEVEITLLADCQGEEIAFHQGLLGQEVILQLTAIELEHGGGEELAVGLADLLVGEHLRSGPVVDAIFNMRV